MTFPRKYRRSIFTGAAACLLALRALAPPAGAQAPTDAEKLATMYNTAMQAFSAGNWAGAASGLEQLIKLVPPEAGGQLQQLYYSLGAAYFNQPNYPKAIETFKTFISKFPQAEKIVEIRWRLAQSHLLNKDYAAAAPLFAAFEANPAYREQAMAAQVRCFKELKQPAKAIPLLEKLIAPEIQTTTQANGAIELAEFYAEANQPDKAVKLLQILQTKTGIIGNLVSLNAVAVKLGDELAEKKAFGEAISAYRSVRPREEVIKLQSERLALMERRMEYNLRAAAGNAPLLAQAQMENQQIKGIMEEQKALLEAFEKLPDFTAPLLFRQARCWYEWDKKWESLVVYDRILKKYPTGAEREPSLYAMVVAYADLNQAQRCQELCGQYLKEFPQGPNAGTVGYLSGAVALQVQDFAGAESFFGIMLDKVPDSEYKQDMRYLLGNAQFAQGKHDEAVKNYERYLKDFPDGHNVEEVIYRVAVVKVFGGEYEQAMTALGAYMQKYPQGAYVADARYRLAVCKYAASLYDEVQKDCETWLRDFQKDPMEGEVQALLGDALSAQNKFEEAVTAYQRSYKAATTDEVINYSIFEASKYLQKLGKWPEIAQMFEEFVKEKPDHPAVVASMFWIAKARARQGQTEEAKAFMVENLRKYIAEPKREAVEQLLTQLAQLCSQRPKPPTPPPAPAPVAVAATPAPAPGALPVATPAPATPPPLLPYDAVAELDKQLAPLETGANATTKARLLFAKMELAKAMKKPQEIERLLREIADRFNVDDLSPVLLAQVGDFVWSKGDADRAAAMYTKLKDDYPKSEYLDFAYVGLGEIAFAKKDYAKAFELFSYAIDTVAAAMKMKEATLGKAKTLMELQRYDESKKLFEQVASVREWRGESTANAVFSLGELEARQSRWAEAIAHYRRVFVAYQKYLPWVAKSYLRSAECFDKLGKRKDAIETLEEMLRNEKLEKLPEFQEAKKKLQEWGTAA
jgi:TolA-binding protein